MAMPSLSRLRVQAQPLEDNAWSAFGWLPVRDTDPRDGARRLRFDWSDAHVNIICHRADEVPASENGLVCQMFFRHLTHTQVLLVLNCRSVIAVAEASCSFANPSELDEVRAFVVNPGQALVLHAGTWHWGPFPVRSPQVDMFNVQGLRYAQDNDCFELATAGAELDIVTE